MRFPAVVFPVFFLLLVLSLVPDFSFNSLAVQATDSTFSSAVLPESPRLPVWVKIAYTAFILVLVPVYWVKYGPGNFLWFSDISLFVSCVALWLENSLLASMMAVGVLLPEIMWNIEYFVRLLTGIKFFGLTGYMFDSSKSLFLRGLSLFHVALPAVIIWLLIELGYDERALGYQTVLAWIVLPLTFLLTEPAENVNWVYGPGEKPQQKIHPVRYLGLVMLFFPLGIYLPTHFLLKWIFGSE
jgi:hypothetical protein